ncbi:MAG: ABC transporter permease [Planctomycetota bacterium]
MTDSLPIHEYSAESSPRGFLYHVPRVLSGLLRTLKENPVLSKHLFKQQVVNRFQGTILGPFWVLIHPLFLFAIYFVIFGVLFGRGGSGSSGAFALYLFSGVSLFHGVMQGTNQAMNSVVGNTNLVKKLAFPSEILPLAPVIAELCIAALGFVIVLVAGAALQELPFFSWQIVLLPLNFLIVAVFALGLGYVLANVSVFYKDIKNLYGIASQAWFFLSPNFWQPSLLLEVDETGRLLSLASLNPTYPMLMAQRQIFGIAPPGGDDQMVQAGLDPVGLPNTLAENMLIGAAWALVALAVGYGSFMSQKRKYADLV